MSDPTATSAVANGWSVHPITPTSPAGAQTAATTVDQSQPALRILHVINGEFFAGAERVQHHLGRCLPECGVRADFVCLKEGRFRQQFSLPASDCWVEPMRQKWDLGVVARIEKLASGCHYDLIHAHTPRSALVAARLAKRLQLPWIYHVHSPAAHDCEHRLKNFVNGLVERWSLRSAHHLITVSHSLCEQMLAQGWPSARVTVVHNGVAGDCRPRNHFPTPNGRWVLGMVALMRPRKGLEIALSALAQLRKQGCDVSLRCIGPFETPEYEQHIRALTQNLAIADAVQFEGFTADVPAVLAELDAMVLPSLFGEGLPMVVLEAMAAGLPVVATRVEGTPEAIQHDRQGLLAEAGSADDLAYQLSRLIQGKVSWHNLSAAAKQRHADSFSDTAMASATADVYRRVVAAASAN